MQVILRHLIRAVLVTGVFAAPAVAEDRPQPGDVGPVAGGGAFVIQTCGETGSAAGWSAIDSTNPAALDGGVECPPLKGHSPGFPTSMDQTGVWVSDRLDAAGGSPFTQEGDRAERTFAVVGGTQITRLRYWRKVFKSGEDDFQAYIALGSRNTIADECEIAGQSVCQVGGDDWIPNDSDVASPSSSYRDLAGLSTDSIILGLYCRPNDDDHCVNGFSLINTEVELFSAFLTISDPVPPLVGTPSGDGWTSSGWVQGTVPLGMASSDVTGISATKVYADGSLIATLQRSCSYDRPKPCSDEPSGTVGLPTAGLPDGTHAISIGAVDAAGNETKVDRPTLIKTDNNAPAAPVGLAATTPATSETNSFAAQWSLPADGGAAIVGARYQVCQAGICGAPRDAPTTTSVSGVALPAAGPGSIRVWLVDALGHESPATQAAEIAVTYAPPTPGPGPLPGTDPPPPPPVDPPSSPGPGPVPPPPRPAAKKADPRLKLTTTRVVASTRRVTVRGTISARASGRVTIRFSARGSDGRKRTVTARPRIRSRRFSATLTLPRSLARARAATVTASYAGDADTKAQSRRASVRWRR